MKIKHLMVFCTCPPEESGQLAELLVDRQLAACVNILPAVTSVYRWQGRRESARESLLVIKTTSGIYPELERTVQKHHPYELPEIIAVPIEKGLAGYLDWVTGSVTGQ